MGPQCGTVWHLHALLDNSSLALMDYSDGKLWTSLRYLSSCSVYKCNTYLSCRKVSIKRRREDSELYTDRHSRWSRRPPARRRHCTRQHTMNRFLWRDRDTHRPHHMASPSSHFSTLFFITFNSRHRTLKRMNKWINDCSAGTSLNEPPPELQQLIGPYMGPLRSPF